ncbi:unnamed protein product [Arctogadus glacialis]
MSIQSIPLIGHQGSLSVINSAKRNSPLPWSLEQDPAESRTPTPCFPDSKPTNDLWGSEYQPTWPTRLTGPETRPPALLIKVVSGGRQGDRSQ